MLKKLREAYIKQLSDRIKVAEETARGINPAFWPEAHYHFVDQFERLVVKHNKLTRRM